MDRALIAHNLQKRFGRVLAVDGITFEVWEGEVFGILGPNGAGKSTTLAMITGLVKADAGTIQLLGFDLKRNYKGAVQDLGVLVENPGFYGHLSAFENLRLFGRFRERSRAEVQRVLGIVGLEAYAQKRVRTFSQGMRKRLGLANALLGRPKLLILDEPTNGLDPKGTKTILDLIKNLSAINKISVIISSNLVDDIEGVCDRALIINEGKALVCKAMRDLLAPGRDTYRIKVEPMEKALAVIRAVPGIELAESADEGYLCIVLSGLTPAELNRWLIAQGLDVFELNPIKKSLKELLVQLKS
jgi:ABC-2 type transport system ATP-binding protein